MNFTQEQLTEAKSAQSAEELYALAKENGVELTEEEIKQVVGGNDFSTQTSFEPIVQTKEEPGFSAHTCYESSPCVGAWPVDDCFTCDQKSICKNARRKV